MKIIIGWSFEFRTKKYYQRARATPELWYSGTLNVRGEQNQQKRAIQGKNIIHDTTILQMCVCCVCVCWIRSNKEWNKESASWEK